MGVWTPQPGRPAFFEKEQIMAEIDPEQIKKDIQAGQELRERLIISLTWLVEDAKYRFDDCKNNIEEGSGGGYSPELDEAIAVLEILKGEVPTLPQTHQISNEKAVDGLDL
jgi:hypothetical protein